MNQSDTARATLDYLYSLQKFGIKMGLGNIASLMEILDHPHRRYPVVHIAGTNGKGSTAAFLASILSTSGLRTGLYTSPHLVNFSERIRIDGLSISDTDIIAYTSRIREAVDALQGTFFEATTAIAFQYFADSQVDIAVVETGLGGRLDSTNVVDPILSIITSIDFDHTDFLGTSLASIATEKAGIIKQGRPVISGAIQAEAADTIRRIAACVQAPLTELGNQAIDVSLHEIDLMEFTTTIFGHAFQVKCPLVGSHQARNALLAVRASELLNAAAPRISVSSANILKGLAAVRRQSGLRCRLERIREAPELVCDVAHNPAGFKVLFETWNRIRTPGTTHLVFGLSKSKHLDAVLEEISRFAWKSITVTGSASQELYPVRIIMERAKAIGATFQAGSGVHEDVDTLLAAVSDEESVLLCGSHYIVGNYLDKEISFLP